LVLLRLRWGASGHPNWAGDADDFPVDYRAGDDREGEFGEFGGPAESSCMGNLGGEGRADFHAGAGEDGGFERSGRDGDDLDRFVGEIPGRRRSSCADAALRRSAGGWSNLALEGGDRCGADDGSTFAVFEVASEHARPGA
jgi:hypothetical protein